MTGRTLDRSRLERLMGDETGRFEQANPRSRELFERAKGSLLDGVPMNWMIRWAGPFPLFVDEATGARFRDVDGHDYVDFCLGDTGAMAGHAPAATIAAVERQLRRGITHMLPTEDAIVAATSSDDASGCRYWQFTLTATDANRFAIRLARHITGRSKILVHNHCYHGSVDETFACDRARWRRRPAPRQPRPARRPVRDHARRRDQRPRRASTASSPHGDVACVLIEPALTNIGIVLPDPGYHDAVRELTRKHGTLLIIDETHTICAGPGGYTARLRPRARHPDHRQDDRRRHPAGAYGVHRGARPSGSPRASRGRRGRRRRRRHAGRQRPVDGGRSAPPSTEVLTDEAFARMLAARRALGCGRRRRHPPASWHVAGSAPAPSTTSCPTPPRNGSEQWRDRTPTSSAFLHLWAMNRGVLMTPFHNMALMSPGDDRRRRRPPHRGLPRGRGGPVRAGVWPIPAAATAARRRAGDRARRRVIVVAVVALANGFSPIVLAFAAILAMAPWASIIDQGDGPRKP